MAGFDNDVVYGTNVDFTGGSPVTGQMTANGQLLIGSAVAPFIRANTLTAGTGISITNGAGTITITNTGGGGGGGGTESLAGNTGSATEVGGVINVVGSGGLTTSGSGQTLTVSSTGSLAALNALAGTGYVVQTGANTFTNRTFIAGTGISLSNADGVAAATIINAASSVPTTFTEDSGTATPSANNLNVIGTSAQGISTSGSGATVTITAANASSVQKGVASFNATNFTVTAGNVVSNAITVTAGTGLTTGGSVNLGGSVTLSLDVPVTVSHGGTGDTSLTTNGVLYGNGTSPVGVTSGGTNGQALLAATGAPPAWATIAGTQGVTLTTGANSLSIGLVNVPNSALANSSITLANGSNITITGSPVSLGGTATINVSGTTNHSVQVGNSGGSLSSLSVGNNGTVLLGATGADPAFALLTSTDGSITFTTGVNSLNLKANAPASTLTITGDTGGALSPSGSNWNILGGTNMSTAGSGSTLTLNVKAPFAATTLTSNSLILGNGTSNVSALGAATNGQLPIGNNGNPPTLATITGSGGVTVTNGPGTISISGGSSPANATLDIVDDFVRNVQGTYFASNTLNSGTVTAQVTGGGTSIIESGHPGIWCISNNSATNSGGIIYLVGNPIILGGGVYTQQFWIKIPILSTGSVRFKVKTGIANASASVQNDPTDGAWFYYEDDVNSGQWQIITSSASTQTVQNTTTALDTGWHVYKIVSNSANSLVTFYIDGVSVGTSSTNLPSIAIGPFTNMYSPATATTRNVFVDLATINYALTSAR